MFMSTLELSHDDKFLYKGQWVFVCYIPSLWNDTCKYCCQDRSCWVGHHRQTRLFCIHLQIFWQNSLAQQDVYLFSKNKCPRVMFKIFGEQLLNGLCIGNTLLLRSFGQVKEVSSLQKIRGYPYWIGPGWPGLGVLGLCWGQWKGCLEGLSGSRGLLSTSSCWQIYCSLCDHMTVMEMAGAVWVADGKKNPSSVVFQWL